MRKAISCKFNIEQPVSRLNISCFYAPPKCVSVTRSQLLHTYAKGAAKLAAPCVVTYLLFPAFPSVCPASR